MRFKPTELATIIVAGIALVGSIASAFYTYTARNRELDIELVKVGIGILRADPKETQTNAAREWPIKIIETHSGHTFSQQARADLLNKKLTYNDWFTDSSITPVEWLANESGPCSRTNPCKYFPGTNRRPPP